VIPHMISFCQRVLVDVSGQNMRSRLSNASPERRRDDLVGRDLVVAKCEESAQYLSSVTTTFSQLQAIPAGEYVVVQSDATYADPGGDVARVASCDVHQFAGDLVVAITS
jgi:hypothetical protein